MLMNTSSLFNLSGQVSQLIVAAKAPSNETKDSVKSCISIETHKKLMDTMETLLACNEEKSDEMLMQQATRSIKELKLIGEQSSECVRLLIVNSLSKSEHERTTTSRLLAELHRAERCVGGEALMGALRSLLQSLSVLESEHHCVKSTLSVYGARAVCDQIVGLAELASLMRHGAHYPLFFLCMQNMHKLRSPEWLRGQLERSKINLVEMLPSGDRTKDRLIQILEDRELAFVYPMLKIEASLFDKIHSSLSNDELRLWIEENVPPDTRASNDFIQSLVAW